MLKKFLLVHSPSSQRAQKHEVISAIAAKDAAEAAAPKQPPVPKQRGAVHEKPLVEKRGPGNFAHMRRSELRGEITGTPKSDTEPEGRMIYCKACNEQVKYNSWIYHCNKHHPNVDENRENDVAKGDDKPENKNDVEDHGDRPAKPTKRRQSEPKPICTINPNVKQGQKVSQKAKKAKSTPAAKETLHLA